MTKTTQELRTETIERTATITLLKTLDLEALIASRGENEMIAIIDLHTAGEYEIRIKPVTRGAEPFTIPVQSQKEGEAFIAGFVEYHTLKSSKRKPRKAKATTEAKPRKPRKAPAKSKAQTKAEQADDDAKQAAAREVFKGKDAPAPTA